MFEHWADKIRRGLKKPPKYIVQRLLQEAQGQAERYLAPWRATRCSEAALARQAGHASVGEWWQALAARPYPAAQNVTLAELEQTSPGESARILAAAGLALEREVDLLGSGPVKLGSDIDWQCDHKTGYRWPPAYCRDIEYNNPDRPSDVKFPWEVSRLHWVIPLGQAYLLTGDSRYAVAARDLLDDWINKNPYACSVNWACTMEVALRILTWTWLFHAFKHSSAWADAAFRGRLLRMLYLHGDFTARNLEKSDINGNHYTADAAGLVYAGLFFGATPSTRRWLNLGWSILCEELPRQVYPDGVDFEASIPYHRLVQELFLLPALYRQRLGLEVPGAYRDRLLAMAHFTAAYSRPDGSVPLWGDADDARALPLGGQELNDHRYLCGIVGLAFDAHDLVECCSGPRSEVFWLLGPRAANRLPPRERPASDPGSAAFPNGGFYVLRNGRDHVFVDCGPLGLGGRGGHGHNDLLSFEAMLDDVHLISDCGAYLYTANYQERNNFRSTGYHNTPKIDGEEINRFVRPDYLWLLHDDARHEVQELSLGPSKERLVVSHNGYVRLESPVAIVRTVELDHVSHSLAVTDTFEGTGEHRLEIPLHLALGVKAELTGDRVLLEAGGKNFELVWQPHGDWQVSLEECRISPSYGVTHPSIRLVWRRQGKLAGLGIRLRPSGKQHA